MEAINVIVVEEDKSFRKHLRNKLEKHKSIRIVNEFDNLIAVQGINLSCTANILLVGNFKDTTTIKDSLKTIKKENDCTQTIALADKADLNVFNELLSNGVKSVLLKNRGKIIEDLEKSISKVLFGEFYFSSELINKLILK